MYTPCHFLLFLVFIYGLRVCNKHLYIMGPLLFNIVINDLPSATKKFDFIMYADDTTLVSTLNNFGRTCNVKEIERNINIEISKVTNWLQRNKLQLNVSKS